jgi:voltage-gated potassium channel
MAILPFYVYVAIGFFHVDVPGGLNFRLLRILRLLRFFRLFRLTAYTRSTKLVTNVFKSRFHDLMLAFILTSLMIVISSCMVYYAENNAQPKLFSSIPATMWWSVETLTTVGFGDMYPITVVGKLFTVVIIMMGVALLALPAGIITSGFIEESKKLKKAHSIKCPHCGKEFEPGEHHEDH